MNKLMKFIYNNHFENTGTAFYQCRGGFAAIPFGEIPREGGILVAKAIPSNGVTFYNPKSDPEQPGDDEWYDDELIEDVSYWSFIRNFFGDSVLEKWLMEELAYTSEELQCIMVFRGTDPLTFELSKMNNEDTDGLQEDHAEPDSTYRKSTLREAIRMAEHHTDRAHHIIMHHLLSQ